MSTHEEIIRYRELAETGDAAAQCWLGWVYGNGNGVPRDDAEAVKWYRKAAEQGNTVAQNNLGAMYHNGNGVPQDDVEAVKWYRKAAEQGYTIAQNNLGAMYHNGNGVPQDDAEAVKWYRKATEQGNADAQFWLGWMYQNGKGVPQDDTEAVKWFLRATEQGNANAQNWLGWMYRNGKGVPQDDTEAVKWYRKAAEQGNADAQKNLDQMKAEGIKVDKAESKPLSEQRIAVTTSGAKNKKSSAVDRHLRGAKECKALIDACTPHLYMDNAFRISGIDVDASKHDIDRRMDDIKAAAEMGDLKNELIHAFAFYPIPSLDQIREAAQRLQEPEHRIIDEFFWFWPYEPGKSDIDPALRELRKCDYGSAYRIWSEALSDNHAPKSTVAKHNLAVMYHIKTLDSEQDALKSDLSAEQLFTISKDWRTCFKWWEELADDEALWSMVADRIRTVNDPRLTTGFARQMRATLPEAIGKINAMLAIDFAECDKVPQSTEHINYMKETHQGEDNIQKTLSLVTKPHKTRVSSAVEKATSIAKKKPAQAAKSAFELLQAISKPLKVIQIILPPENHERIDLCDTVAEACLTCQIAYAGESEDWTTSFEILEAASKYAASKETIERLAENRSTVAAKKHLGTISDFCKTVSDNAEKNPYSADKEAQSIINAAPQLLLKLSSANVPDELILRGKDQLALMLMHCAVIFGNKTDKWKPCVKFLEEALKYASSQEVKSSIEKNLLTVKNNERLGDLSPISSAPSLSTFYGIGFRLYGSTDADHETGSYLSTYYFTILFIPVFPICRYRLIPIESGYRFLGKAPLRAFDKWHLFISLALLAIYAFYIVSQSNSGTTYRSSPSSYSPSVSSPAPSYDNKSTRSTLALEIEEGKTRAKQMETQIMDMDNRLANYERKITSYRDSGMTDEYNSLVPSFNSLVSERKNLYEEYRRMIDEVNAKVRRYNLRD
jgi:TPR repeat protein